jgi:hypothetical protein
VEPSRNRSEVLVDDDVAMDRGTGNVAKGSGKVTALGSVVWVSTGASRTMRWPGGGAQRLSPCASQGG